jgi:hypothetical protein
MAKVDRINGFGQYTTGTVRTVAQLKAFLITVKDDSSTAVDLQSLDDGADEMVEAVIREVQPLMYYLPSDNSGTIHVIVDGHAVTASSLQDRLRVVVAGVGGYVVANNDTTVAEASSITIA